MTNQTKQHIQQALQQFQHSPLRESSLHLLATLGYQSDRQMDMENTPAAFLAQFNQSGGLRPDKALVDDWLTIDLLCQITDAEIKKANQLQIFDSAGKTIDGTKMESYLFMAIALSGEQYTRTQLAQITREVNKLFLMPVNLIFRHGQTLTIAIINRRLNKKDGSKDVLDKVTLLKDIRFADAHRAHKEILTDLSLETLYSKFGFKNFVELHQAWQKVLDTSELNKNFYREIALAFQKLVGGTRQVGNQEIYEPGVIRLPSTNDDNLKREFGVRLIGRLLFCWFLTKKSSDQDIPLIPSKILSMRAVSRQQDIPYYHAVLEPLFFETLNKPVNQRLPQYQQLPWSQIPFLNGGLFEPHSEDFYELDGNYSRFLNTLVIPDNWCIDLLAIFENYHGSPSPIVQIQEQHIPGLKSLDEHFIIHHPPAPSRIQDYRNRKYPGKTGHYCTICAEDGDVYKLWNALSPLPQQLHALDAGYANRTETRLANDSSAAISLSQCAMQAENFC